MNTKKGTMRIFSITGLILAVCYSMSAAGQLRVSGGAQNQNTTPKTVAAPQAAPPPAPFATSEILQPSLDVVQQTLGSLRVEKWKRGTIRDEASSDINEIQRDLQDNLPPLLKEADTSQGMLSKVMPVARHVDALYDVLLRVVESARFAAPDDQANQLREALSSLGAARLKLDDRMQERATAEEGQVGELRTAVLKQASFKCPAPAPTPVCTTPPPAKKTRKKPAATQTSAPAHSNSNANPPSTAIVPKSGP
jgi:hypothetical protein